MEQILSSRTAFFAIVPALIAGIVLRASGFNEFALVCLAIGGALLALFLLFRRQYINITDIQCGVSQDVTMGHFHPIEVRVFIGARHPVELLDCKLIVTKNKEGYYISRSGISVGDIMENIPRSFVFRVPLEEEDTGQLLDWGLVYIRVPGRLVHTPPFQIKTKTRNEKGWFKGMAEKLIPKTRQLKDKGEITKKELHELLDKASQPIK